MSIALHKKYLKRKGSATTVSRINISLVHSHTLNFCEFQVNNYIKILLHVSATTMIQEKQISIESDMHSLTCIN